MIDRIKALSYGDPVTNVCAGESNPHRLGVFVKMKTYSRKSRYGFTHTERFVVCTDGKGNFWETSPEVVFPGHLDKEESRRLWKPIWEAEYGRAIPTKPIGEEE